MDNSNNILHRIEQIHAMSPNDAIVLDSNLEAALRKAIANAGGGDLVAMPTGNTAPSYTGRVLTLGERSNFFEVANAPILGVWAGTTLIAEREAKRCRVARKHETGTVVAEIQIIRRPEGPPLTVVIGDIANIANIDEAREALVNLGAAISAAGRYDFEAAADLGAKAREAADKAKVAIERAREAVTRTPRTLPEKAVSTLCLVAGDEQAPEAARVAALQALGHVGAALAAAG
jgi:hypothetical protein